MLGRSRLVVLLGKAFHMFAYHCINYQLQIDGIVAELGK